MKRTYKGRVVDMDALMSTQGDTAALGNMRVNARGDKLGRNGEIIEKAGDVNRKHYKNTKTTVDSTASLKGELPEDDTKVVEKPAPRKSAKPSTKKEIELESGDIIVEESSKSKK